MSMKAWERILGVGGLIFAGVVFFIMPDWVPMGESKFNVMSPAFFPLFSVFLIALLSCLLFFRTFNPARVKGQIVNFGPRNVKMRVLLTMMLALLFPYCMEWFGYMTSAVIFSIITMVWFGARKKLAIFITSISTVLILYYCFKVLLKVPLPIGRLFD